MLQRNRLGIRRVGKFRTDVCEEAGLDGLTDDLVMSYQRDDGSYATVTRSVPLEAIVEAPTLRLKPAKSKKGRR